MDPSAPLPALDLTRISRSDDDIPRAVLDVLVDVPDDTIDLASGHIATVADDDDEKASTFVVGEYHLRKSLTMRRARDAWRLAVERGLVPASWQGDPRRCFPDQELLFFCADCGGMGATGWNYDDLCPTCNGRGNQMKRGDVPLPTSIQEVRWMIAHPDLVEQAEALAREAVRRLGPATPLSQVDRVQWGRVRHGKPLGTIPVVIVSPIWGTSPRAPDWDWNAMKGPAFERAPWWPEARKLDELTRQILCFDVGMAWRHAAAGVERSPFEPLLRLWELGVMMEELTPGAIVLERARHRYIRSWRSGVPCG